MFCVEEEVKTNEPCIIMELCTGLFLIISTEGQRFSIRYRSFFTLEFFLFTPSDFVSLGGSLYNVLEEPEYIYGLKETDLKKLIKDVTSGMSYLREKV